MFDESSCRFEKKDVYLIVFGSVLQQYKEEFNLLLKHPRIKYAGWVESKETYKYLAAADLVIFPGLHSVMWEQAVALGVPCVFKDIKGFRHVDIGGNAVFLKKTSVRSIRRAIVSIACNPERYHNMKKAALSENRKQFLYSSIAKNCLK